MTDWRTRIDTEWADERTVIDPCSLDTGKPHGAEQRVPSHPPCIATQIKQLRRPRLPSFSLSRHKTTLAFTGLGIALILVTGLAVHEHGEANALREAFRIAKINRVDAESGVVDSMPIRRSQSASQDRQPAALLTADDRARVEREATDFIVAHKYDAALRQFEVLRNAFPEHRAYSELADALRWKLRCVHRGPARGGRCN